MNGPGLYSIGQWASVGGGVRGEAKQMGRDCI